MISSELQTFLPEEVSDDNTNGGAMSTDLVVSGVVQNVWSHVSKAERLAGSRKYRGLYDKVSNDDDESLLNAAYYLDGDSLGEDWFFMYPADLGSTQVDWVTNDPPTRKYVSGYLKTTVTATDTSLTVVLTDAEQATHILNGDNVLVTDKTEPDAVAGDDSILTINAAPSVASNEVTISFSAQIGYAFTAGTSTKICVLYEPGVDVACDTDSWTVTTAGDGDATEASILLDNIGTIKQTWTFTFTGATAFTVSGDTVGALAAGSTASEYAPSNADWTKPYFTIPTALWTGTWASGDTLVMETLPAAIFLVQERRVPAGCASLANNRIRKVTTGESPS